MRGQDLIMYKCFTYCLDRDRYWKCSIGSKQKCHARLVLNTNKEIVKETGIHNHEAPQFLITKDGDYVRLSKNCLLF